MFSCEAEVQAQIDDVSLRINTREDYILLLEEFFTVCLENHLRLKLRNCGLICEEIEFLGFDVGYIWWKLATPNMQPLEDKKIQKSP